MSDTMELTVPRWVEDIQLVKQPYGAPPERKWGAWVRDIRGDVIVQSSGPDAHVALANALTRANEVQP